MDLTHVFQQNNPVLISVFLFLCLLSLTSWYIIFWKAWRLHRERAMLETFRSRHANTPDWPRHLIVGKEPPGFVGELVKESERLEPTLATFGATERRDVLSMHLVQVLDRIRVRLDKGLTLLASVGSSSPFIGLFGTVWGIYGALMKISAEGNAGLSVVAGPMGEALVATATGLFAAIPAVLAYNGYVRVNRLLVQDLRHIAEQITMYFPTAAKPQAGGETVRLVREGR